VSGDRNRILIRTYNDNDEPGVVSLWSKIFPNSPQHNNFYDDIKRKTSTQGHLFFVASQGSKLIGSAMAGFDGHRGWVYYVAVHPDYRSKGLGRRLMSTVEAGLEELGCTKVNLQIRSSNAEAMTFYKKIGYSVEDRISMGKILSNS
jgi:ribosomal protein S18 acetylase RimI-like enzyme